MPDTTPVPAFVYAACANGGCVRAGARQQVRLRMVAMGLVELPALVCAQCGHTVPVFWPGREGIGEMAKITVHGGVSDVHSPAEEVPAVAEPPAAVEAAEAEAEAEAEPVPAKPRKRTAAPKVVQGTASAVLDLGGHGG